MTDEVERVARAMEPGAFATRDRGYTAQNFKDERAFLNAEKVCKRALKKARAAIAVLPTTFTGPWVKEVAEDGTVTVTDVGETDIGNKHVYSAEDVKVLFGS